MSAPAVRGLQLYYLAATPAFFVADRFFGVSVRAAFLDGWPAARYGYYAVCFACGLWTWRAPALTAIIAKVESSANIILLVFSVMMHYYAAVDRVVADVPLDASFGPAYAANLVFAAGVFMVARFRSMRAS